MIGTIASVVRGEGIASAVREAVWSIDRGVPVSDLQPMRTMVGTTLARPRLLLTLLAAFAIIGLALGAIGVYGVVAFGVARRRREIGIRMALGARAAQVIRLVLQRSLVPIGLGIVAGIAGSLAASRLLTALLFHVEPGDPAVLGAIVLLLGASAIAACLVPARRAASVDPLVVLRDE